MIGKFKINNTLIFLVVPVLIALKLLHIPFSSEVLIIGLSMLSLLIIIDIKDVKSTSNTDKMSVYIQKLGAYTLAVANLGMLFKLQFWPNATNMLLVAIISLGILIALGMYYLNLQDPNPEKQALAKKIIPRSVFYLVFCALFYFTTDRNLIDIYYKDDAKEAELVYKVISNRNDSISQQNLKQYRLERMHLPNPKKD